MTANQAKWVEIATRLQMLSQRYSKTAQQAALGNPAAFDTLEQSSKAFSEGLEQLISGGGGVASSPAVIQPTLTQLKKHWDVSRQNIQRLSSQRDALVTLGRALSLINVRNTELLDLTNQVIALLPADARRQTTYAYQQALWTQRMAKNANALINADLIDPEAAYQLGEDLRTFQEVLDGLLQGSASLNLAAVSDPLARDKLLELKEVFASFKTQVDLILQKIPQLSQAKQAARDIFTQSEQLLSLSQALTDAYRNYYGGGLLYAVFLFGIAALALLILLGALNLGDARRRAEESARVNKRNQDAILRLLNEMGDLAEGDLTVQATVTEDITGAIADSVNYAIDELRMLVTNINRATAQVTEATDAAKRITDELLAAAERQSERIAATSDAVNQMSQSSAGVSQNAAESSRVAELSLATARKGGESVRNAIAGMNALRDQIQETAKRIKRLG
ncbi:MAG: type IV pili methyl-accepting chemotaxis transducer N-terminal domain-containing protein, partial [Thiobacillaceae bacterium]